MPPSAGCMFGIIPKTLVTSYGRERGAVPACGVLQAPAPAWNLVPKSGLVPKIGRDLRITDLAIVGHGVLKLRSGFHPFTSGASGRKLTGFDLAPTGWGVSPEWPHLRRLGFR
jgi:hypothetical protein